MQINITAGRATISKIDALKAQYGSRSQVVAVAIDRLFQDHSRDLLDDPSLKDWREEADNATG